MFSRVFRDYERTYSPSEIYLGKSEKKKYDYNKMRSILIHRYNFLYNNAPLILAQFLYEHKNGFKSLCEDLELLLKINIDGQIPYDRNYIFDNKHLSILHLVEEYMFGDIDSSKELRELFEKIRNSPCAYLKVKEDFFLKDSRVGLNRKDMAIQVLFELMRSHIFNQQYGETSIIVRNDSKAIDLSYLPFVKESVTSIEKGYKQAALEQYLSLCHYRNLGYEKEEVSMVLPNYQLPVIRDVSLVGNNDFLKAIWDLDGKLTFDEIRKTYFSHHEEIPWDTKTICEEKKDKIKRSEEISPCGSTIYLDEDNIFYRDESFFMICPKCGYMINIDGLIDSSEIRRRIEFRYWGDKFILRKQDILSELVSLDGIDKAKSLVKERK